MLSSTYRSGAKFETHASLQHSLLGAVDDSLPRTSIFPDPTATRTILSVLKAPNFTLRILPRRKHLDAM